MARLVDAKDWSQTPLGPRDRWPHSLKWSVRLILASGFPMAVRWGPDLVMIYNDAYRAILGDKHPHALGAPLCEVWPEIHSQLGPLNHAIVQGTHSAYFADDQVWRIQRYGTRFEDAHFAVSYSPIPDEQASSGVGGVLVTTIETTDRFSSEQALRELMQTLGKLKESERQFRLLVDGVIDHALYMLDTTGTVASWNSGAQRIKGYSSDEIIGRHFSQFYTEEDRAKRVPWRALDTARTEGRYAAEGWRVRKDGTRFWASVAIDTIHDERGELVGFAKITRDVTERRNAQLALEQSQRQLAYAQKMEALGQLTGGVAHDFNNMLMVISGQAQALLGRLTGKKNLRSARAIKLAAERGETLTRQLLAFSRRQALNPTPIRLQDRFEEFRDILVGSVREDVRLAIEIAPEVWPVAADVAELQLAVVNVVVNARDAMPNGGAILISAENVTIAEGAMPDLAGGDFVAIKIADTGSGISEEVLPRIFEPFFTTKQQERGTGLGLSQVYGFARQSGGTVSIASKLGRGTTVTLYLPRTLKDVVQNERALEIPKSSTKGATILVVEDNPQVSDVAAELIESLGYRVIITDCGAAALEILQSGQGFDLVFSDVVLPGDLDGFALAERIRASYPSLPVLLTTGYARSSAGRGEFPILRKPYQLASLAHAIRGAIAGSATLFS